MSELIFSGNTNDLLAIYDNPPVKQTRLFKVNDEFDTEKGEIIDVTITSSSNNGKHEIFDRLLNKEIEVIVRCKE